jgi:hypothetical protein
MKLTTKCHYDDVEIIVEDGSTTIITSIHKSYPKGELQEMLNDLLDAAYDLAGYTDKSFEKHLEDRNLIPTKL